MFRFAFASFLCLAAAPVLAEPVERRLDDAPAIAARLQPLKADEASLAAIRSSIVECEAGCSTPTEAVALAFAAGEGGERKGRFLLDIRSGGQSLFGNLEQLYFVNSRQDYAEFGTLTIAFAEDVLNALLKRART